MRSVGRALSIAGVCGSLAAARILASATPASVPARADGVVERPLPSQEEIQSRLCRYGLTYVHPNPEQSRELDSAISRLKRVVEFGYRPGYDTMEDAAAMFWKHSNIARECKRVCTEYRGFFWFSRLDWTFDDDCSFKSGFAVKRGTREVYRWGEVRDEQRERHGELCGSCLEVRCTGEKRDRSYVQLFRFHPAGDFDIVTPHFVHCRADWHENGRAFGVVGPWNEARVQGELRGETIAGHLFFASEAQSFIGKRVDGETYEFPLDEAEIIVAMTMLSGPDHEDRVAVEKRGIPKGFLPMFVFDVLGPEPFEGACVTGHHDGDVASGPASKIASFGQIYLWRTDKKQIGYKYPGDPGTCSVEFWRMVRIEEPLDPRYRPARQLQADILRRQQAGESFRARKTGELPRAIGR